MTRPDRFAKLTQMGAQAPLMPLVSLPPSKPAATPPVARLSVSMPPHEAERAEGLARELAMATGDKPTTSELVRAGLELLAALKLPERQAVLARLVKSR